MSRQFVPQPKRDKRTAVFAVVLVVALLFAVPVTRKAVTGVFRGIGMLIVRSSSGVGGWISHRGEMMRTKRSLVSENEALKRQLEERDARLSGYIALSSELSDLKEIMGRSEGMRLTLASVLSKPPVSAYDTILIDGGEKAGILPSQVVYAAGSIPVGTVESVAASSALVRLYSSPGQRTDVRLSPFGIDITLVGRGGGNFIAEVPHDLAVTPDAAAMTKELDSHLVARFHKVTSDPRDPFQTILMSAPVNVRDVSFVQVRQ